MDFGDGVVDAALPASALPLPTHRYLLDGNFDDAIGGIAATCNACVAPDFSANGYHFNTNEGLVLSGAIDPSVYTIDLVMSFDTLGQGDLGNNKMIDFKDRSHDEGLYARLNGLQLVTDHNNPDGMFNSPDQPLVDDLLAEITMTRDATAHIEVYINKKLELAVDDPLGTATFTGTSAHFGDDDLEVPNEAGPGTIRQLTIWNVALTAGQIALIPPP